MPASPVAYPGHRAGGDLQGGEQGSGAVPETVMGALLGLPGLHRQQLLGPVQRLDPGVLACRDHEVVLSERLVLSLAVIQAGCWDVGLVAGGCQPDRTASRSGDPRREPLTSLRSLPRPIPPPTNWHTEALSAAVYRQCCGLGPSRF